MVVFFVYLMSRPAEDLVREIPSVSVLSTEKKPIGDLINACIAQVGEDALRKLGDRGGYVDSSSFSYNAIDPTVKGADAVQFSDGSDLVVPYWHFLESSNDCSDCVFNSRKPLLFKAQGKNSIEEQLNNYVSSNLRSCIDFDSLKSQGYNVVEKSQPKVEAIIAKDSVGFKVEFPLEFELSGNKYSVGSCPECFVYKSNINLLEVYNFASKLNDWFIKQNSFEILNKRLISYYSGLNKPIPPVSELDVGDETPKYWLKSDVSREITGLLSQYLPLVQVEGTSNYHYISSSDVSDKELYEQLFNRDFYIPINDTHSNLEVRFAYLPVWNPYFEMNCKGELCTSDSVRNNFILPYSINRYSFSYDLSYPVLVMVSAPGAFNGKGYNFEFFIESNMRGNEPLKSDFVSSSELVFQDNNFCNPEKFTSGNISINIKDKLTSKPVSASISYTCGSADSCFIGSVNGSLTAKFPRCTGGRLLVDKRDYHTLQVPLDVVNDKNFKVDLELQPLISLNASLRKWSFEPKSRSISKKGASVEWVLNSMKDSALSKDEYAVISLSKRKDNDFDVDFSAFVDFKPSNDFKEIKIIPGVYDVKITGFIKPSQEVKILPHDRVVEYRKWYGKKVEEDYKLPSEAIVFSNDKGYLSGGAEFVWKAPRLNNSRSVVFSMFGFDLSNVDESSRVVEDLEVMNWFDDYSKNYEYLLSPVVK